MPLGGFPGEKAAQLGGVLARAASEGTRGASGEGPRQRLSAGLTSLSGPPPARPGGRPASFHRFWPWRWSVLISSDFLPRNSPISKLLTPNYSSTARLQTQDQFKVSSSPLLAPLKGWWGADGSLQLPVRRELPGADPTPRGGPEARRPTLFLVSPPVPTCAPPARAKSHPVGSRRPGLPHTPVAFSWRVGCAGSGPGAPLKAWGLLVLGSLEALPP